MKTFYGEKLGENVQFKCSDGNRISPFLDKLNETSLFRLLERYQS